MNCASVARRRHSCLVLFRSVGPAPGAAAAGAASGYYEMAMSSRPETLLLPSFLPLLFFSYRLRDFFGWPISNQLNLVVGEAEHDAVMDVDDRTGRAGERAQ